MGQRQSAAVYRRRRIVALLLVLVPALLIVRACSAGTDPAPVTPPAAETATATAAVDTSTAKPKSGTKASDTRTASAKAKETVTATAAPVIGDCANSDIQVSITADAESYAIGKPITMAMRISNTGRVDCKRDVGALSNEVYVTDLDGAVVWSSDACQTNAKPQVALMRPGAVFGNTQQWSGRNSGRDCSSTAPDATAGSYLAYARNDTVVSKPFAFTIG